MLGFGRDLPSNEELKIPIHTAHSVAAEGGLVNEVASRWLKSRRIPWFMVDLNGFV